MNKNKIHLFVDLRPCVRQQTGVGQYTHRLVKTLLKDYPSQLDITGFHYLASEEIELRNQFGNIHYLAMGSIRSFVFKVLRKFGILLPFELVVSSNRFDVHLFPDFVSIPSLRKTPTIVAVHDLCFQDFPEFVQPANRKYLKHFVPTSIKRAANVITISDSTKNSISEHYDTPSEKFVITPIPPLNEVSAVAALPDNIPESYILFVSTLEPRKNVIGLVEAYAQLKSELQTRYALVLAGGTGWLSETDQHRIEELQKTGLNIVLTGFVSEAEKASLYEHASLFVLPSHYEGFGVPVLEAMSYGVPVAISDIPVFKEVAGDAASYFDKDSPADIASKMEELLTDLNKRKKLSEKGYANLKRFNWNNVAKTVFEAIQKLVP